MYCTSNNSTLLCFTEDIPTYEQIQDTNDRVKRYSFVSREVSVLRYCITQFAQQITCAKFNKNSGVKKKIPNKNLKRNYSVEKENNYRIIEHIDLATVIILKLLPRYRCK